MTKQPHSACVFSVFAFAALCASNAIAQDYSRPPSTAITPIKPIRAGERINRENLAISEPLSDETRIALSSIIGKAARRALYPGKAITLSDTAPLQVVDRNDIVQVEFTKGLLELSASGRALGAGGIGETIRVMNMDSRSIISGVIIEEGKVKVR